jgi:hypothetical protein
MSLTVIVILMYHRHRPTDIIYNAQFLHDESLVQLSWRIASTPDSHSGEARFETLLGH